MKYLTYKEKVSDQSSIIGDPWVAKKLKRNYAFWHVSVGEDMVLLIEFIDIDGSRRLLQ